MDVILKQPPCTTACSHHTCRVQVLDYGKMVSDDDMHHTAITSSD